MSVCIVQWVQWALGPVEDDVNVRVGKWVKECLPDGGDYARVACAPLDLMALHLELMSPPLELVMLPLECAPFNNAKLSPGHAPLEVVVLGVGEISAIFHVFQALECQCGFLVDGLRWNCDQLGRFFLPLE